MGNRETPGGVTMRQAVGEKSWHPNETERYITRRDGCLFAPSLPPSQTAMSSVVTSRTTPAAEVATLTPPMTPPQESKVDKDVPADLNIPDNYVAWTLKNQKERPPISWDNWWKELNYLSLSVLTITPAIAIWGALNVPLRWQTAVFSVFYYFFTGLGEHFRLVPTICLTEPS